MIFRNCTFHFDFTSQLSQPVLKLYSMCVTISLEGNLENTVVFLIQPIFIYRNSTLSLMEISKFDLIIVLILCRLPRELPRGKRRC